MITNYIHEEYCDSVDLAMQLTTQTRSIPEEYRASYCDFRDEAEEMRTRISTISSPALKKDKVQSSPDPDPMANDVIHLLQIEDRRDYYRGMYLLSMITLRNRCRDAGFSDEQTEAICMYYGNREKYGYGTVADVMHTNKDHVAYLIQGGRTPKSKTDYKISAVYMDIEASIGSEKQEELQAHGPDVDYPFRGNKRNGGNDNGRTDRQTADGQR